MYENLFIRIESSHVFGPTCLFDLLLMDMIKATEEKVSLQFISNTLV